MFRHRSSVSELALRVFCDSCQRLAVWPVIQAVRRTRLPRGPPGGAADSPNWGGYNARMGIRFSCPNGHRLNVKAFLAGRRGICPFCGAKFTIPSQSTAPAGELAPDPADASPEAGSTELPTAVPGGDFERELARHIEASAAANPSGPAGVEPHSPPPPPAAPQPAIADPLAETPAAVWYVRPPSGGQFGPAQSDLLSTWLNEGRISPDTLVWREGWADWREAASVFPSLQPATSLAPEPPIAAPAGASPSGGLRSAPRRRRGPNLGLIVVLALAALLLLAVFLGILMGLPTR